MQSAVPAQGGDGHLSVLLDSHEILIERLVIPLVIPASMLVTAGLHPPEMLWIEVKQEIL